jgi:hypothetical protein
MFNVRGVLLSMRYIVNYSFEILLRIVLILDIFLYNDA